MAKFFETIKVKKPKRAQFDLSHERKFSMNMAELVPILCEEVVPGDSFKMSSEVMMRLAPLTSPVMHRVNVHTHFFFVPNRLVWDEWQDFITGGEQGDSSPVFPYVTAYHESNGSLSDYLGVYRENIGSSSSQKINALPFRAYHLIFNEYYRDQNLQSEVPIDKGSGADENNNEMRELRTRNWEKDYFTSALPWTQRGGDVSLPIDGTFPVELNPDTTNAPLLRDSSTGANLGLGDVEHDITGLEIDGDKAQLDPNGSLEVNTTGTNTTIEDLRVATRLQRWLERNARGGSRYIEQILSHFGVKSSDARLQRPEFLGGGKSPVVISEVLQTSATETGSPQANMAGHGVAIGQSHSFKKYFEEHGFVIGIMSVLPRTTYNHGTRRMFRKFDKFDYFWPEFANLGEQPVYDFELFMDNSKDEEELQSEIFGYQSRYAEYKHIPSTAHGDFRSGESLEFWHMGRKFDSAPSLNSDFVEADPTHRIFAVETETVPKLYVQVYNDLKAARPMPYYGIPTF